MVKDCGRMEEKLVKSHIITCLPADLDPFQFTYKANRSTEDTVATTLHSALTDLEQQGSYTRLLFVDFSLPFNTILPQRLVSKLADLRIPSLTCSLILDFRLLTEGQVASTALKSNTTLLCALLAHVHTLHI